MENRRQKTENRQQWQSMVNANESPNENILSDFLFATFCSAFILSYHHIISMSKGFQHSSRQSFPDNLINCSCHACIFIFRNWLWCGLEMGVGPRPHLAHYHQPLRIELFLWPLIPYVLHFARPDGSLMSHLGFAELLMTIPRIKDMRKYSIST